MDSRPVHRACNFSRKIRRSRSAADNAFAAAPAFIIGSSSCNPGRGPAYKNLDLVLMRWVQVSGARVIELRAEVLDATNTAPLGAPNTTVGAATIGAVTSAGDPRVVQLAVKFVF